MERQISCTLIVSRGQNSDDIPPNFKPKNRVRAMV